MIDTAVFISIAFIGVYPLDNVLSIMLGQYVFKLAIAALDTPIVYLIVWRVRSSRRRSIMPA